MVKGWQTSGQMDSRGVQVIIICICPTNKMISLCICIRKEYPKCAWFIPEVTLNQANVVFSILIFIDNSIVVPSKHQLDLLLASNYKARHLCTYVCMYVLCKSREPLMRSTSHLADALLGTQEHAVPHLVQFRHETILTNFE